MKKVTLLALFICLFATQKVQANPMMYYRCIQRVISLFQTKKPISVTEYYNAKYDSSYELDSVEKKIVDFEQLFFDETGMSLINFRIDDLPDDKLSHLNKIFSKLDTTEGHTAKDLEKVVNEIYANAPFKPRNKEQRLVQDIRVQGMITVYKRLNLLQKEKIWTRAFEFFNRPAGSAVLWAIANSYIFLTPFHVPIIFPQLAFKKDPEKLASIAFQKGPRALTKYLYKYNQSVDWVRLNKYAHYIYPVLTMSAIVAYFTFHPELLDEYIDNESKSAILNFIDQLNLNYGERYANYLNFQAGNCYEKIMLAFHYEYIKGELSPKEVAKIQSDLNESGCESQNINLDRQLMICDIYYQFKREENQEMVEFYELMDNGSLQKCPSDFAIID